jgi:hypothetical protein
MNRAHAGDLKTRSLQAVGLLVVTRDKLLRRRKLPLFGHVYPDHHEREGI